MKDKTHFTLKHAQLFYQTLADIIGEKYNVKINAKIRKKGGIKWQNEVMEKEQYTSLKN